MRILTIFLLTAVSTAAFAQLPRYYQQGRSNEGGILPFTFSYGFHLPGGDLADRFGISYSVGGNADYLTKKDFLLGVQSHFIFGSKVKTDVLAGLRSDDDLMFGSDGAIAEINLRQRGIYVGGHIGKIFRLVPTQRSGIRATVGAGFFQHKIRIQDDATVVVPYLDPSYKKGYDRLTNGLALTQFIGYQHLGKRRRINFVAGLEFTQGFTQSRRNFDFDTRSADTEKRLDLNYSFRIGWTLPLYVGEDSDSLEY